VEKYGTARQATVDNIVWPMRFPCWMTTATHIHTLRISNTFCKYWPDYGLFRPKLKTKLNSVALVRERTIPTERPPPVGEVSANFCG